AGGAGCPPRGSVAGDRAPSRPAETAIAGASLAEAPTAAPAAAEAAIAVAGEVPAAETTVAAAERSAAARPGGARAEVSALPRAAELASARRVPAGVAAGAAARTILAPAGVRRGTPRIPRPGRVPGRTAPP